MQQVLLRYILVALVVGALLKYTPNLNLEDQKIITLTLIATALVFAVDMLFKSRRENMESVPAVVKPIHALKLCDKPVGLTTMDEDEIATTIRYDHDTPMHPLLQYGGFEGDLRGYLPDSESVGPSLKMGELPNAICQSKMSDLVDQHNHKQWTPHTHIGKARSYLNWKTFY